jgi:glycosyltransferase involved in cell wall biosynthesis
LACSVEAGIALYGKKGVRSNKFAVIKNAIDTQKFVSALSQRDEKRKQEGVEKRKVIINIGRLCEQKNQAFLLKVFKKLHEKDDTYALFLVGEGGDRLALEQDYASLIESGSLRLLGNRTDIPSLLALADVFVFPSVMEGLGIALIEAQASGITCISSSAVPQETAVSSAVKYLDLALGEDRWVEEILASPLVRHDTRQSIIDHGYDIKSSACQLEEIYLR